MKPTITDWVVLACSVGLLMAALAIVVGVPACTSQQRQQARDALRVADEACDVLVLLDDEAVWVCVPVAELEDAARRVRASDRAVTVELPAGPGVRPVRSVVVAGPSRHFQIAAPPASSKPNSGGKK